MARQAIFDSSEWERVSKMARQAIFDSSEWERVSKMARQAIFDALSETFLAQKDGMGAEEGSGALLVLQGAQACSISKIVFDALYLRVLSG